MQALPPHAHLDLSSKFAQLEFKSPKGEVERGRTIFETLVTQWPKRLDLWNVLLDFEITRGDKDKARSLFERVTSMGLKSRMARKFFEKWLGFDKDEGDTGMTKDFFKKWLEFEERVGDTPGQERVKRLAEEYVRRRVQASG